MIIGIDGTTLCDSSGDVGAGIEHYTWEISHALIRLQTSHTFVITIPPALTAPRLRELIHEARSRVVLLRSFGPRISFLSHHILMPLRFFLHRADVIFAPSGQLPILWRGRSVITVHDVAIYEHAEWFADLGAQSFSTRVIVPRSIACASRIISVSETTHQRLLRVFSFAKDKTVVVHEGVSIPEAITKTTSTRFPFDRDFILFLGTIEPRKNLSFAIKAFEAFLQQHPESAGQVRFVIAGKKGWGSDDVFHLAEEVNRTWFEYEPDGIICFLGTVTEEEKWLLLSRASLFVYPSLYEGFGLPVLEAMASGTPVIISSEKALQEVGGDTVIVADDVEAMSLAIAQCLLVPEGVAVLREEGIARAKGFSWSRAAEEMMRVFEGVGNENWDDKESD